LFAQASLFLWPLLVMVLYTTLPPRKAVISSFVFAWLFLPTIGFNLPGLPDYTKMTATIAAVLLALLIFDPGRLFSIRPRWFDLPIIIWCLDPFVTAIMNDLGPYEGLSAILEQVVAWGLPYLIGRVYLGDLDSLRDLVQAIAIGGLLYMPLCLLEIRLSPVLSGWVYGMASWEGLRFGGYRPKVFLSTGLELGLWMTNATLISYALWSSGTIKSIRDISFGMLTLALAVTTFLCKATGALAILIVGVAILWLTRRVGRAWLIWLLIAIPPTYTAMRTTQLWSGRDAVEFAKATVGVDRAESLQYRLNMENMLVARALERPIFGWGRFNRFQVLTSTGKWLSVPDGFWIISLGTKGLIGLTGLLSMMLLPMVLTIRRFPVATWSDPAVGPVVGLALMMTLTMVDYLSNAMLNPVYALVIGGLMGQSPFRPGGNYREAEETLAIASELVGQGRVVEAGREFRLAIELASGGEEDAEARRIQADALDGLGQSLLATGRDGEAVVALRDALALRDWLAGEFSDADHFSDLAIARDGLSRALAESGRTAEAIGEREIALQIWKILAADHPRNDDYRDRRTNTLNDLAWLLATDPDPTLRDPARSLSLAEEAVRFSSNHDASWNTLGVARYRAGDWAGAIEALERSVISSSGGLGTAFDHYFLAMAWFQLQHEDRAREWLERGVAWAARHRPGHLALERFRQEAELLMQGKPGDAVVDIS
jgi:tetratricopeptide (TPR) repeat protein